MKNCFHFEFRLCSFSNFPLFLLSFNTRRWTTFTKYSQIIPSIIPGWW